MISDLLDTMAADMNISRYRNESDKSFTYRICYSALGQWCLNVGRNRTGREVGTTKHNQTIILNELSTRYTELYPYISDCFVDISSQPTNLSVFIRRVYEETGCLLTDENNHNRLANYGRSIRIGNESLFFGLPSEVRAVNGLGVFSATTKYEVSVKDFLVRDSLTCEEYFKAHFDPIDFYTRDIDLQDLEFFSPLASSVPSQSWRKNLETDCSVARKFESGPFYRVMQVKDDYRFADEPVEVQSDTFTSYEYRRLYFALKSHYGNPLAVRITRIDEAYSRIRVSGFLPNREYYFLLLLSWPERSAFDKVSFIIRNSLLEVALSTLENIGLNITGGRINE